MIIETLHFGEVEIDEKSILDFEEGIPGLMILKSLQYYLIWKTSLLLNGFRL
jgi:flagellar assembly factor FliW